MMSVDNARKHKVVVGLRVGTCIFLSLLLLATAGCRRQSVLEMDYGNAWAHNQAVEIANPKAGLVETPAVGLNPKATASVLDAYNKSFTGSKSGAGSQTTINLGGLTTAPSGGGSSGGGN
jgi:hypothetical protein